MDVTTSEPGRNGLWRMRIATGAGALEVPRFRNGQDQFMRELEYEKAMRFRFLYADPRLFHVERWWSRRSREDWTHLAGPAPSCPIWRNGT